MDAFTITEMHHLVVSLWLSIRLAFGFSVTIVFRRLLTDTTNLFDLTFFIWFGLIVFTLASGVVNGILDKT